MIKNVALRAKSAKNVTFVNKYTLRNKCLKADKPGKENAHIIR